MMARKVRKPQFVAKVAKEMQQKLIASNLDIGSNYIYWGID